jgi:membrane protease YdiL (CAAX protease family)
VTIWLSPALPSEQTHPLAERSFGEMGFGMALWMVLLAVVFAPVVEEVLFRGVLFQVLWQRTGRVWLSALVSGFLFGIIHPQFLGGILSVTLLGITLSMVYAHTRSLLPCIVIHALNNAMATLVLWVFSG